MLYLNGILIGLPLHAQTVLNDNQTLKITSYVNPLIGTGGHGHTFPGPVAPFGMVQLSPDTRNDLSWDGCGGYYYEDSFIYGFSHTHLSGTGVSDFGDVLFQPSFEVNFSPEKYKQRFLHDQEKVSLGYYQVLLQESQINIELTASEYTGFQRYVFPRNDKKRWVLLDLRHRDSLLSFALEKVGKSTLKGHRQSRNWADNQWVFFLTRFDHEIDSIIYNEDSSKCAVSFNTGLDTLCIQTTLSFTSAEGTIVNESAFWEKDILQHVQRKTIKPYLDFDEAKWVLLQSWERELGRIQILDKSATKKQRVIFYSALYHCMIHPSLASDANGKYRGRDQKIHQAPHNVYHVFSLWDTYRALHPLLTLIDKERTKDFILTMLLQYEQGGKLPVWELGSCETNCMIGFHSVPVILEAVRQGIVFSGEDIERLWKAVKNSSDAKEDAYVYKIPTENELLTLYGMKLGYIDVLNQSESVSKTLEYAFDDFCVSELAKFWGKEIEYQEYKSRSNRWRALWDDTSKSFRPKRNGLFVYPYSLFEVNNHYTEANAWQYRFAVPHDVYGLIDAFGGRDSFEKALDQLFSASTKTTGREQADISGLIGQYAHGNEPSHHMAYLYNYVGRHDKSKAIIQKIQSEFYTDQPDGYIGNEDCGQMSAWHVLSALGIYKVCPGNENWDKGYALFDSFQIRDLDSIKFQYLRDSHHLSHQSSRLALPAIHTPELVVNNEPFKIFIKGAKADRPVAVFIRWYRENLDFEKAKKGYYQLMGKDPTATVPGFGAHHELFLCYSDTAIESLGTGSALIWAAYAPINNVQKQWGDFTARFVHVKSNQYRVIALEGAYNPQYTGGGRDALVDEVLGSEEWKSGAWQGYQSQDFQATIDLQEVKVIDYLGARFLSDERAWIFLPKKLTIEYSIDGIKYTHFNDIQIDTRQRRENAQILSLVLGPKRKRSIFPKKRSPIKARYIRISAQNFGKLPMGHPGHEMSGDAFIFIDEVWVNPKVMELL